ncbi:MAG: hypothetical protein AB7G12_03475 [Thermoanaerobaculia bacterium]
MSRTSRSFAGVVVAALLFAVPVAAEARQVPTDEAQFSAGEELARTITVTTGVPISPLLGVSGLGAWRWYRTPEAARARLPWYAKPWFWGSGFFLVFLFAANTTIGGLIPGLKKPMDFVEEHENKFSALLATPAVLLEVKRILTLAAPDLLSAAGLDLHASGLAFLTAPPAEVWLQPLVTIGLAILYTACYFVVFIAFHAIQVLIALSPSAILDLFLRGFRLSLLGLLGFASWIHPYLGATLGFAILFVALLIAGWSFRLTVYGSVFSWEILTGQDGSADPAQGRLAVFSQRGLKGVPVRSFGRLENNGARWFFSWRPWLVLPRRSLPLPAGEAAVLKGVISPLLVRQGALRAQTLARFPPRYRGREVELAKRLDVREVLDGRIVRGLKAAWKWLRETVFGGSANADSVGAVNAGT